MNWFICFGLACGLLDAVLKILDRMEFNVLGKIIDARERRIDSEKAPKQLSAVAGEHIVPVRINPPPCFDHTTHTTADLVFASREVAQEYFRQNPLQIIETVLHRDGVFYVYTKGGGDG